MNSNDFDNKIKKTAESGKIEPQSHLWQRLELKLNNQTQNNNSGFNWLNYILGITACLLMITFVLFEVNDTTKKTSDGLVSKNYMVKELAQANHKDFDYRNIHTLYNAYDGLQSSTKSNKSRSLKLKK